MNYYRFSGLLLFLLLLFGCTRSPQIKILKDIEYGTYPPHQGTQKLLLDLYLPAKIATLVWIGSILS